MSDRYTQMAEEWEKAQTRYSLHGRGPKPISLAALLRRVAKEELASIIAEADLLGLDFGRISVFRKKLRARAKELED